MTIREIFELPPSEISQEVMLELALRASGSIWKTGKGAEFFKNKGECRENWEQAVEKHFANADHGQAHGRNVALRALYYLAKSPNMSDCHDRHFGGGALQNNIVTAASIFHDFGRSMGFSTADHEEPSAWIAFHAYDGLPVIVREQIFNCIRRHDYFCPIVDGTPMPDVFDNPLAEIVRLADKTSVAPDLEVRRWWDCGKEYGTNFFDRSISDDVRFDLQHNYPKRDQLTYLLMIFALQPRDFLYAEAAEHYRCWAKRKDDAVREIFLILRELSCVAMDVALVRDVLRRFQERFKLEMPAF